MWELIVAALVGLVILYFVLGKKRGDSYVRQVAQWVAKDLRDQGEPEGAIKAYLNSVEYVSYVRSSFGKKTVAAAVIDLEAHYDATKDRWREIAQKFPVERPSE